jgi:hypothetical protein
LHVYRSQHCPYIDLISEFFETLKCHFRFFLKNKLHIAQAIFVVYADMLTIIINHAKKDGHPSGLIPHLEDGCVTILQYANDKRIILDYDLEKALNIKLMLCMFE